MNIYSQTLKISSPFNFYVLNEYKNGTLPKIVQEKLEQLIEQGGSELTPERLNAQMKAIFCPSPDGHSIVFRKKKLINQFWTELEPPSIADCSIKLMGKTGIKTYSRNNSSVVAASFGGVETGQFGEFNHPLMSTEAIAELGFDANNPKSLKAFNAELDDETSLEVTNIVAYKDGSIVESFPIGFYGIKMIPITVAETIELQANNGTFSAEIIANHHYQRLVLEGCAFTPLFSSGSKTDFDKKVFTGDNITTLNRLQRTLKRIRKDVAKIDENEELHLAGNLVNQRVLDSSIFSDKIGLFTTTWVGHSLKEPPIDLSLEEILLLAVDAFWTMEQAILNKVYITDLNIGNILYYDMSPWVYIAGWTPLPGEYSREYSWDDAKSISFPNNFARLVFVDLGTSLIENPSLGNRRIIDKSVPITKNSRCDIINECRSNIIEVIHYLAVVNNCEKDIQEILHLNSNKNLFFQLIELQAVAALANGAKDLEAAEKYHSKVFR